MDNKINLVLGFDFGMKYIGIATGQTMTKTASPLTSISATDGIPDWNDIAKLIEAWKPNILVVGLPLNMDGTPQLLSHRATKFANRLKDKFKLPVHLVDERLSTWEAKQRLETKTQKLSSKELLQINAEAAAILVEQWLNNN